jgi:hypothetical protein
LDMIDPERVWYAMRTTRAKLQLTGPA